MFVVTSSKSIYITRGDIGVLGVSASKSDTEDYIFQSGDVVRLKVFEKKQVVTVVLQKDVRVSEETAIVDVCLEKEDTKIGDLINKPVDYWYEIELNPDTHPQTIVGYDEDGPKIFRLFPEGGEGGQ